MNDVTTWIEEVKGLAATTEGEVTRQWLERAEQDAPYSVLPALLYLEHNGVKGNEDVLARLAISFPDRHALGLLLIDRFLDNYGKTSPGEVEAISRAIFNPQPDYADVLAAQEKEEGGIPPSKGDSQDELINQFIAEQMQLSEQAAQAPVTTPIDDKEKAEIAEESIDNPTQNDDSMLSESLAKMYISRHKYSQALEIIKRLSLKYPEKSIYFADQIRFLTKLVLNETLNN